MLLLFSLVPKIRLSLVPKLCLALVSVLSISFPSLRAADREAIDKIVQDGLKAWQVPGVAVAVVHNDEVIYLKGYGVKELGKNDAVTPDTLFPLASCTKAFTTTAMAMLVDEGKMSWDDPVRKYVDFFHLSDPHADTLVTLRDLVSHRTGIGPHELLWYRAAWSQEESIRRIGLVKPSYSFRSGFQYQTTMFTTAGLAVARASKLSWADFVQKRLFDPLEMKGACFTSAAYEKSPDHASPHRACHTGRIEVIPRFEIERPDPAGSIHASARDLTQWVRLQLNEGTVAGKKLVSAKNLNETHTPQNIIRMEGAAKDMNPDTTQMSYGMGWVIQDYRGQKLVSHAGAIDGFRAHITLVPKAKLGIILLNNLDRVPMNLPVSNNIVDLLLGLPTKDWNAYVADQVRKSVASAMDQARDRELKHKQGTKPSCPMSAYTGTYEEPAYGRATITLKDDKLVWKWSSFTLELEHYEDDCFMGSSDVLGNLRVVFLLNPQKEPVSLKVQDVMDVEFKRVKGG